MNDPVEFYNQAVKMIENSRETTEDNRGWAGGEKREIVSEEDNKTLAGRPVQIWLKNEIGEIFFTLFLKGQTLADNKYYRIKLAHSVPVTGWSITSTEKQYLAWRFATVKKIKREIVK